MEERFHTFRVVGTGKHDLAIASMDEFNDPAFIDFLGKEQYIVVTPLRHEAATRTAQQNRNHKIQFSDLLNAEDASKFYHFGKEDPYTVKKIVDGIDLLLKEKPVIIVCRAGLGTSPTIAGTYLAVKHAVPIPKIIDRLTKIGVVIEQLFVRKSIAANIKRYGPVEAPSKKRFGIGLPKIRIPQWLKRKKPK